MGKASRNKKRAEPDVPTSHANGTCTRCHQRPRMDGPGMWCAKCVTNARRLRASRPGRRAPRTEMLSVLDALEAELTQQERPAA